MDETPELHVRDPEIWIASADCVQSDAIRDAPAQLPVIPAWAFSP